MLKQLGYLEGLGDEGIDPQAPYLQDAVAVGAPGDNQDRYLAVLLADFFKQADPAFSGKIPVAQTETPIPAPLEGEHKPIGVPPECQSARGPFCCVPNQQK